MAHKWRDIRKQRPPERQARIQAWVEQESKRLGLTQLREAKKRTQTQLAELLDTPQNAVSKMEHSTNMYLSSLRS